MNLLLDTHSLLWFIAGSSRLTQPAKTMIEDGANACYFSMASMWEMAIKLSIGKLSLTEPFDVLIPRQLKLNRIILLDIKQEHLTTVIDLPFRHRDPFDRLLVAQCMREQLSLVSADAVFDEYAIERLW